MDSFYENRNVLSETFEEAFTDYNFRAKVAEPYEQWLQQSLGGDLYAMATLAAVSATHSKQSWPVPPGFRERWVIQLLGEGEGTCVLGLQYALIGTAFRSGYGPGLQKAREFLARSACTGHIVGMGTLGLVASIEEGGAPFTPPASPRVDPIPARFWGDPRGEASYWETRPADAGYWKSAAFLGMLYARPESGPPDHNMSERYMTIAAHNGSEVAALSVAFLYTKDEVHTDPLYKSVYTYVLLASRLLGVLTELSAHSRAQNSVRATGSLKVWGSMI